MVRAFSSLRKSLVLIAAILLAPSTSMGDMIYEFIKLDCDKQSKSADIKVFYDWNESGKERVARHEKHTYYFGDVFDKQTRIRCSLGDGQVVSATVGKSARHPANDNVMIRVNNIGGIGWIPLYPPSEIFIQTLKSDDFKVRICRGKEENGNNVDTKNCESRHIVKGERITD